MRGAIPALPNTPPWRGAQLKSTGTALLLLSFYFTSRPTWYVNSVRTHLENTHTSDWSFETTLVYYYPLANKRI
jgi:hypothetical protein